MMKSMRHSSRGQVGNGRLPIHATNRSGRWSSSCQGMGISEVGSQDEEAVFIEGGESTENVFGGVLDRASLALPRRQMRFHMANLMLEIEAPDRI